MHMHHTYLCIKCTPIPMYQVYTCTYLCIKCTLTHTYVSSVHSYIHMYQVYTHTYLCINCTPIHIYQVYTYPHVSSVHSPIHMHLYGIQPTLTYVFTLAIVESNIWISLSTETRVVNNFSVTTTTTTKSVRNFFRSGRVLRRFRFYHRRRLASFSSTSSS